MRAWLVVLLALTPTAAFAAGSSAGYEYGGAYARYEPIIEQYNRSGELFRIDGRCQSACTLFLGIRNVCVGSGASFLFHAAHDVHRVRNEYYVRMFLDHYNERLRSFLIANHAMDQVEKFYPISGTDMVRRFGYPPCPRK